MKDVLFIEEMLKKGKDAGEKAKNEFSGLSLQQLNWKPSPENWSIGQCLDHLVVSDCLYFPALKKIAAGSYEMTAWEKWNPLNVLFGRMLAHQLQENVKKKVKAPEVFAPEPGNINTGILERFQKHLDTLLEYIAACEKVDLDKTHITSPVSKFVTYSLQNAIIILIQHEHRHINQAIKIKKHKNFPE
jgi:uncharacterized damage-inducible protein DinB